MKSREITFDKVPYRSSALHQRAVLVEALISSNSLALCFPCTVFKQLSKKVISGIKQNVFSTGLGAAILN